MLVLRNSLMLMVSALVAYVQGQCSSKFSVNSGHYCFKYIAERMTYSEAMTRCNLMGAVVAHPAAQDWETWRQDVMAVTRNDDSVWVGTSRNKSGWYWLNTGYAGQTLPIRNNLRNKGDISISDTAWGIGSNHKCTLKYGNETVVNKTMTNKNMTNSNSTAEENDKEPEYCSSGDGNCAYFGTNGKLSDTKCEDFNYVVCQGPNDYTSSCDEQNCTENAYNFPISFTLCGCKCMAGYLGDGYNSCYTDSVSFSWAILGFVVGALIILICCAAGVRKQVTSKSSGKEAVRKSWGAPILGVCIGILIIWLCL
ncbi:unnamed protein product [Meganyctiphanes norvegica]|uniref:C-type lectin domain-containing protein n=1 Tax=Meganyctiphanes norvegica TaxID=48144 RepID=A0AAV2S411_MEGNR